MGKGKITLAKKMLSSVPSPVMQSILNNNPTLDEVLKCEDLAKEYRNRNKDLMQFLLKYDTYKQLLDRLMETNSRSEHNRIIQLLKTSNDQLHQVAAYSLPLVAHMFQALEPVYQENENGEKVIDEIKTSRRLFAAGTFQRLLERALDTWPHDCADVFRVGEDPLFKKVIMHLDALVVFRTVADQISDEKKRGMEELMWHIWYKLMTEVKPMELQISDRPRCVFLKKDLKFDLEKDGEFGDKLKERAVELLKLFFNSRQQSRSREKEGQQESPGHFGEVILRWIATLEHEDYQKLPGLYELAGELGYKGEVWKNAIEAVKGGPTDKVSNAALAYIVNCSKRKTEVDIDQYLSVIAQVLGEPFDQYRYLCILDVISALEDQEMWKGKEAQLKDIVQKAFDAEDKDAQWKRPICVQIAMKFKDRLFSKDDGNLGLLAAQMQDEENFPTSNDPRCPIREYKELDPEKFPAFVERKSDQQ